MLALSSNALSLALVMTKLYCKLVNDALNEFVYDAEVAGLKYSMKTTFEGILLIIKVPPPPFSHPHHPQ